MQVDKQIIGINKLHKDLLDYETLSLDEILRLFLIYDYSKKRDHILPIKKIYIGYTQLDEIITIFTFYDNSVIISHNQNFVDFYIWILKKRLYPFTISVVIDNVISVFYDTNFIYSQDVVIWNNKVLGYYQDKIDDKQIISLLQDNCNLSYQDSIKLFNKIKPTYKYIPNLQIKSLKDNYTITYLSRFLLFSNIINYMLTYYPQYISYYSYDDTHEWYLLFPDELVAQEYLDKIKMFLILDKLSK